MESITFKTGKGEFIATPISRKTKVFPTGYDIIGLKTNILKREELAKHVVDINEALSYWESLDDVFYENYLYLKYVDSPAGHSDPCDAFQSLCTLNKIDFECFILKKI